MKLIIDIGNSRTKFYLKNYFFLDLDELIEALKKENLPYLEIELISTVENQNLDLINLIYQKTSEINCEIRSLEIIKADPEKILGIYEGFGADRYYRLLKSSEKFPEKNIILIDFGTATTVSAISSNKTFLGGFIRPSIHLSLISLHEHSAALPEISETEIENFWIKFLKNPKLIEPQFSTTESMLAGVFSGELSKLKSLVNSYKLPSENSVIILNGSLVLPANKSKVTILTDTSILHLIKSLFPDFEIHVFDFFF